MVYEIIDQYYSDLNKERHQRYKSWEHCYSFYRKRRELISEEEKDYAMLHLAFYLASWGMYRGSSFLLQKDYKVHKYALEVILKEKYYKLWDMDLNNSSLINEYTESLFSLKNEVIAAYIDNIKMVNGIEKKVNITDTLATKILLGTYGCIPAYDRYFISGLKFHGIKECSFNKESFHKLVQFYEIFKVDFDKFQEKTKDDGFRYSIMKLMDMYFWQVGYWLDGNCENNKILDILKDVRNKYIEEISIKEKAEEDTTITFSIKNNKLDCFKLPDNLKGRNIHTKVIPTVCSLRNMLHKLIRFYGDEAKLKSWERTSYKGFFLENIKSKILDSHPSELRKILREHILSNPIHVFGANVIDIYLVAYVSENYGVGKEKFFEYIKNVAISEKNNSINAIWQVGKGDGVYLGILNEDGTVKDWDFMRCWINGEIIK